MESHSATNYFDPQFYVDRYYNGHYPDKIHETVLEWAKEKYHNMFAKGKYRGKRLLDVGSGPVVSGVIPASKYFDEVYVSDLSQANVDYIRKWIRGESEHMKYLMKQYAAIDDTGVTWEEKNNQVRKKIKDAIVFDMLNIDTLSGTVLDGMTFDAITSSLAMGTANKDGIDSFSLSLKNFSKLLNPGGHLMIVGALECTWYAVEDMVFRTLSLTKEELIRAFESSGFKIEHLEIEDMSNCSESERTATDTSSMYSIVGKKI